ncbi:hypothetical protein [Roseomonas elaeocarpi]|uniref:Uncharacterized protein n=1 Tax=Roseomonas elaeocarpi TaxID=907779 RepID=A0ABV6JRB8_9PROT
MSETRREELEPADEDTVLAPLTEAEEGRPHAHRPSYKPEEGAPDAAGEVSSVLRAVLFAAVALAVVAALITLWRH